MLMKILRYIEENYRDGSLQEISSILHYQHPTLSRLLSRRMHKSFTELMQEKRLSQAAWLLLNTNKRVDEIARLVGYENMSYFHKLFSKSYGKSPKNYRDCK